MTDDPAMLGPQQAYEAWLGQGRFMLQKSRSSGEYVFYPKVMAPSGAIDLEWVEAAGTGTVYSITVNRRREGSYNVALVDLDEGVRMMATVAGPETVPIGTRVRARIEAAPGDGGIPRIVFDPIEEA
ncbi:Zn-ribbon domain-containing OB-fold protein [Acidimangrovimonas sediminis]|uniref:Zn-ribbon domain-containing OB-fold protein n=1 Tax=Acidimangrovimonas sediminis TaxID=2056283 RepID=UPI000C80D76E|nr:OB-fold domain-containing protein [Acidimangrovimonas sediminis]